ncbi:DinB family protein [Nonomuraea sp. NBC_01738]|uniref:mycothiol transferase n=1 Tax=Nonomuraea sp. NBC_01738 TaxID=2976003 RepID=UPI002E1553A4|nr:DinB family protein [Nonomuraea sp. NBC_01738]
MTEDQRVSRNPAEPPKDGPAGAERWVGYLDWQREDLIRGICALSPAERRTSRLPSGWTPIELLSHLVHMEQRWFVWGFLGEQVAEPWGDWNVEDPGLPSAQEPRWVVAPEVTAEELAERLRALGRRTGALIRTHAMDERAAIGGRFGQEPPTLEWICFHVLAEYARHAGQFDVVAEIGAAAPS